MPRHEEGFFTSPDGTRLFWESDSPEAPRAFVGIVHGYADHCGRYRTTIDDLVREGFSVFAFDYRGHGQSAGRRGHCEGWGEYLEDLGAFWQRLSGAAQGQPTFLLGHSHGGLMLTRLLEREGGAPQGLTGAILSAPYLKLAFAPPKATVMGAKLVSRVVPWLPFKNTLTPKDLTRDPTVQAATAKDRLYNTTVSPRWFVESNRIQEQAIAEAERIKVPLFVFCGSKDPVASAAVTRSFFERVGSTDKRLREYPEMLHECLNEVGREEVVRDIAGWISAHLMA